MPGSTAPRRPQAALRIWSRVAVLALVGIALAGCENSARFDSNPFASNDRQPAPRQEVTGSIATRPATTARIQSQPLPAPSRPATVASSSGVSYGDRGFAAYRPQAQAAQAHTTQVHTTQFHTTEVTGSVPERRAPPPSAHWTWDGGSPVTVGYGDTVETIARKYGVPASAIMETNGITSATQIRPGQRLVIPRYVAAATASQSAAPAARAAGSLHVVEPGESLLGIARHYGVSHEALARANGLKPYTKINIGDRLKIPAGGYPAVARRAPEPRVAQPRTVPADRVASVPAQTARVVTPEHTTTESVEKTAVVASAMPSFRWPVKGRIIAAFGKRPNGTENDGINLAVPEGTPIKAADDGVVAYAGNELKGYGNLVLVRHANGFVSAYANASALLVKRGDTIKRGQVIARAGQTGNVTSPQLHFEIRKGSTPVDPTKYLSGV
jgi:murein DD-endopeptidase MepM/ murein hydrolase activator NlpD